VALYTVANHHGYATDQRALAVLLLRLFAPQLFFYGAISLFTAVLNLQGNFAAGAFAPVANNVVAIASLVLFALRYPHASLGSVLAHPGAILLLGLGSTAGVAAQMLVLIPVLARVGVDFRPHFGVLDPAVREMLHLSSWTIGFVLTNQVAVFVVLAIADTRPGFVSAYNYAYLFFQLPYAIVSLSIMTALQPRLARLWANRDHAGFAQNLSRGLQASVSVALPLAVAMFVGAPVGIDLVLRYGAVGATGVLLTAHALQGFALGLPGFVLFLALVQGLQATRNARVVFFLYLLENGVNIVLAFVLVRSDGVEGLAVALAVAYTVGAIAGLAVILRMGVLRPARRILATWVRVAVVSAVSGVVLGALLPSIAEPRNASFLLRTAGGLLVASGLFVVLGALGTRLTAHERGALG
jgi:putative peptidoglycan lipid II flippase